MPDLSQRLQEALAGRYRIGSTLGRGGMATVFLAEDLRHHRQVAIKVLDPEVAAAIGPERFLSEIETVARLSHPHILPLFDSGEAAGFLFYVTPCVTGGSLRQQLDAEKQLPIEDAVRVTREVADALDYAHRQGVVHRDVKPENILLEEGHAVVADFGIARATAVAGGKRLTATGISIGTPAYMSPEQAVGSRDLDGRSDLYSLGCVLYEMLAGQPPFSGPTAESMVHQHMNVEPRPVRELRPTVPASVTAALQRALAKTPADRFATTGEFAAACARREADGGQPGAVAERSAPGAKGAKPPVRRIAVAAAGAVIAAVAIAAWQGWGPFPGLVGGKGAGTSIHRDLVLVADFDGPPDDPSLARAARELVVAALDQSTALASVSREQIREALERTRKPDTLRLTPDLAREIAYRSKVRAMLAGEVVRLGNHFTVSLRVTDVEDDKQVLALTDVARSEDDLIPVLRRMGARACERLSATPGAIRTTRGDDWPIATASFEAYRRLVEANRLYSEQSDYAGALRLAREVVTIDPECGSGWGTVAWAQNNLGHTDSALVALREAMRHPRSITPAYRLYLEGVEAMWKGDARRAAETFDRVARAYPHAPETGFALNNWKGMLISEGRMEMASDVAHIEDRLGLRTATQLDLVHRTNLALMTGRLAEARSAADSLRGNLRFAADLNIALASARWGQADSMSDLDRPGAVGGYNFGAPLASAQATAARGEASAAAARLLAGEKAQRESGMAVASARMARARVLLALMIGRPVPRPEPWLASDTTTSALITRGYLAAAAGETTLARQLLTRLRARSTTRLGAHGSTPEFIEASIAAHAGRWNDVVGLIAQPARDGSDHGYGGGPIGERIGTPAERWLVAQAYERLNQPDSAASFYLRMLGPDLPNWSLIGLVHPFAHQRLALLYARMGRLEEAERHLAILERDVTRPDPDVRRLLDEARAAVRSARGMAAPEAGRR